VVIYQQGRKSLRIQSIIVILKKIIRCAWCKNYFCFDHFFEQYHYCNNYI